jgi:hypothetical protein
LIAKYPVWERHVAAATAGQTPKEKGGARTLTARWRCSKLEGGDAKHQERSKEQAQRLEQIKRWREEVLECPDPSEGDRANDARVIRQLVAHYGKVLSALTPEERTKLRTKGGEIEPRVAGQPAGSRSSATNYVDSSIPSSHGVAEAGRRSLMITIGG